MKTLKIWTAMVLLMGFLVLAGSSLEGAAQDEPMTNAQLANIVINILGIEMPANADTLSDAEFFEVQANMLAERGLTLFVDASADGLVTRGAIANVLYGALVGPSTVTTEGKIDYLANLNYISPGDADEVMGSGEIISALNVPVLSAAVAEAYSVPGATATEAEETSDSEVSASEPGEADTGVAALDTAIMIPPAAANPASEGPASSVLYIVI